MQFHGKRVHAFIVLALASLFSLPAYGSETYHRAIAKGHELGWACHESSRYSERWTMECRAFLAFAEHGIGSEITEFRQELQQAGFRFLLSQNAPRMQESAHMAQDMSYLLLYARALRTRHVMAWKDVLPQKWLYGSIAH
ncbi:hypothetical protein OCT51_12245 [Halomonas sp. LR3S48]|uniref:hypothetical protein n=1 Tax=Halomonas sp. LR3S48 TaxID=2982694 RepID=UPI0021E3BAC6|nr:hypothetical protein [Halomonas sp. LR3S48]UYG01974.1 hypothetical protein OCT51_12245 [Halomonas sp. LR3S48]